MKGKGENSVEKKYQMACMGSALKYLIWIMLILIRKLEAAKEFEDYMVKNIEIRGLFSIESNYGDKVFRL